MNNCQTAILVLSEFEKTNLYSPKKLVPTGKWCFCQEINLWYLIIFFFKFILDRNRDESLNFRAYYFIANIVISVQIC